MDFSSITPGLISIKTITISKTQLTGSNLLVILCVKFFKECKLKNKYG